MTWMNALWAVMFLLLIWGLYRLERKRNNTYSFVDMLLGPDGKASLTNHILIAMALMAIWVCVDRSNDGKDVDNLVLGVLGIFVIGKTVTATVSQIKRRR